MPFLMKVFLLSVFSWDISVSRYSGSNVDGARDSLRFSGCAATLLERFVCGAVSGPATGDVISNIFLSNREEDCVPSWPGMLS